MKKKICFIMFFAILLAALLTPGKLNAAGRMIKQEPFLQTQDEPGETQEEPEENPEEPSDNFWSIDTVFYDSAVDQGHTALTQINWNATSTSRDRLPARTIAVQITYRNTNSTRDYAPGELKIVIPNLMAGQGPAGNTDPMIVNDSNTRWDVRIPANDEEHVNFDWNFATLDKASDVYVFTNHFPVHKNENFEGTLTLTYTIDSMGELTGLPQDADWPPEELYQDSCFHKIDQTLQAILYETETEYELAQGKEMTFHYEREYTHPWRRQDFTLKKGADPLDTREGLPEDADDYIWVKYWFQPDPYILHSDRYHENLGKPLQIKERLVQGPIHAYPNIYAYSLFITDTFPKECVVLDYLKRPAQLYDVQGEDGTTYCIYPAEIDNEDKSGNYYVIVGYPTEIYNEQAANLHITNTAELHGTYGDRDHEEKLADASVSFDLSDFAFVYHGDLYRVDKYNFKDGQQKYYHYSATNPPLYFKTLRYQDIVNDIQYSWVSQDDTSSFRNFHSQDWYIQPTVRYPGFAYDMVVGDDLMYSTDLSGNVSRVPDDDYCFMRIWFASGMKNTSGNTIEGGKYDCELWVRRAGSEDTDYELYDTFKNTRYQKYWTFTEQDRIVGYYFVIKNMTEGVQPTDGVAFHSITKFKRADIPYSGFLHNFSFLEIYREVNGRRFLQNEPGLDSYATDLTQQEIAAHDMQTFGHYRQRGTDKNRWEYHEIPGLFSQLFTNKRMIGVLTQDAALEAFTGRYMICGGYGYTSEEFDPQYFEDYLTDENKRYLLHGFRFYDLLPEGMELDSTAEEIKDSMILGSSVSDEFFDENMKQISDADFEKLCRQNLTVTVEKNWKGTDRTKITVDIDLREHPFYYNGDTSRSTVQVFFNFRIPYSAVEDYGKSFRNNVYMEAMPGDIVKLNDSVRDSLDLNENGSTYDMMERAGHTVNISYAPASRQGLTKLVETDSSPFTPELAFAGYDHDYRYRLRVSTGASSVTNLVIYDAIEGYTYLPDGTTGLASGDNEFWRGNFTGVDTSFAKKQGWTVRVWYSTGELPGKLGEDESWQLLTEDTPKDTVRALAFEYLDSKGSPAVLKSGTNTYVDIQMHAPTVQDGVDSHLHAYNGSWTNWNALNDQGTVIPNITGIQSNIVEVTLNEKISLTVTKRWVTSETWVPTATVILTRDGETISKPIRLYGGHSSVTLPSDKEDLLTVPDLERFAPDGHEYEYIFVETGVPKGYLATYSNGAQTSAEPRSGYNQIINTQNVRDISVTKTWSGDNAMMRPGTPVVITLMQNGKPYKTANISTKSDTWSYKFSSVPKYDKDGKLYDYEVVEEPVEGYETTYDYEGSTTVYFSPESFCESSDKLYIYYKSSDSIYRCGPYYWWDSYRPAKINIPSSDLYFYWVTNESDNRYWGFAVDRINGFSGSWRETVRGERVSSLPDVPIVETTELPQSPGHSPYEGDTKLLLHYTGPVTSANTVNITNRATNVMIRGTKRWEDDDPALRPDSVTVRLYQNDELYEEMTTDASKKWAYSFTVPETDAEGKEYVYRVEEDVPDGYKVSYEDSGGVTIVFNEQCRTSTYNDYLEIYYRLNGKIYKVKKTFASAYFGSQVSIPSSDIYFHWHTSGNNRFYGYKIDEIRPYSGTVYPEAVEAQLPAYDVTEITDLPESPHNPVAGPVDELLHLEAELPYPVVVDITNTKEAFGDLEITKKLPVYKDTSPVTFVFSVVAKMPDGTTVYDDIVSMTFDAAGEKTVKIEHLPSGAQVTVTEIYSGAGYTFETKPMQKITIIGETERVTFVNSPTEELNHGYGILNTFTYEDGGWTHQSDQEKPE